MQVTIQSNRSYTLLVEKSQWYHLRSNEKCQDYNSGNSHMLCMIKKQINCFLKNSNECACIPAIYKTQFEILNISLKYCKKKEDFWCALGVLNSCYFTDEMFNSCPISCTSEVYNGVAIEGEHGPSDKMFTLYMRYRTTGIPRIIWISVSLRLLGLGLSFLCQICFYFIDGAVPASSLWISHSGY